MSEITRFNFDGSGVRSLVIQGEPWFVASDVCAVLGIVNSAQAVDRLEIEDLCFTEVLDSNGRRQRTSIVNESGLYELIIRSNKPDARRFRRWLTTEVIPTIRKTGSYSMVPVEPQDDLVVLEEMIANMRESRRRIAAVEQGQNVLNAKVAAIEGAYDEFTTLAYAKLKGLPSDRPSCQRHGQRASRLMRARGQQPRKRQDATFGSVNVYPVDVLDETVE